MKISDITTQYILNLTWRARTDGRALTELQKISYRVADNANRRFKTFEKHGEKSPAYSIAKSFLAKSGRTTFSKSKKMPIAEMRDNIIRGLKFLNAKTGTLKGYHEYEDMRLKSMEKRTGVTLNDENYHVFKEFLKTEIWQAYNEFDSKQSAKDAINMINGGLTMEQIKTEWEKYENKVHQSILDVWEEYRKLAKLDEETKDEESEDDK